MPSARWIRLGVLALGLQLVVAVPSPAQVESLDITIPVLNGLNPASRPPVATYEWETLAGSPDPVEVRTAFVSTAAFSGNWALTENYLISTPDAPEWSAWGPYAPPATGTSLTTAPMAYGGYVFAVQGRDGSGTAEGLDPARNMRRVLVSQRTTGPLLTVTGDHIETIHTASPTTPPQIITVPAGTSLEFCWSADATAYGGIVTGYRYGWDILDLADDAQWAIPWTPFSSAVECSPARAFYFGTHRFSVQVKDNDDFLTLAEVVVNVDATTPVEKTTWGRVKALYE